MIGEIFSGNLWLLLIAQATLCIALGLAASFLLKRSAAKAHRVLLTALVAAVLTPGAYLLVRHFRLGVLVSEPACISHQATEPLVSPDAPVTSTLLTEVEYEPGPVIVSQEEDARIPLPWGTICLVGWISLTTILLGRFTLRFALGLRLLAVAQPLADERLRQALESAVARLGIARPIQIRCSDRIKSPIIWCWTRQPVLLVHAGAATHPDGVDWVGIFCHELAHLKRRDHLSGLFAETLTALFPWHPLLWWAASRLAKLSEQACDDWVLAAGQSGVDYAETLLGLSAQRQMAFIPTVVGKEKTMSTRIRRIIRDRCGDPRVGARWMAGVGLLAILAIVSVGFAQRRPAAQEEREIAITAEQPAVEQPQPVRQEEEAIEGVAVQSAPAERREPTPDWQREVLQHKFDELAGQIQDKETMLRENHDLSPDERRVQEFELAILYEMAAQIEQRLRNIERPEPRTSRGTTQQRAMEEELAIRRNQLEKRRQELTEISADLEQGLQRVSDSNPDLRRDLEVRLDKTRQEILMTEDEFRIVEKRQQAQSPATEQPRAVETRRRRGGSDPYGGMYGAQTRGDAMYGAYGPARAEQNGTKTETRVYALDRSSPDKMRAILEILHQLPETTVTPFADNKLAVNTTTETHLRIEKIIRSLDMPEAGQKPPLEVQVQDLRSQMQGLQERMEQMQKLLEQVAEREKSSDKPQEMRMEY
jgi:beta-lactamase regulating signal transducer with metallopeptidase domain